MRNLHQLEDESLTDFLRRLDGIVTEMGMDLQSRRIDEVALLAPTKHSIHEFINHFLDMGLGTVFAHAEDHVRTMPFDNEYEVEYTFFQPHEYPWRIEMMRVLHGVSPLHTPFETVVKQHLRPVAVHASFKCADLADYGQTVEQMYGDETVHHAQSCVSTYGAFSYWAMDASPSEMYPLYLKPRVNLRDAR